MSAASLATSVAEFDGDPDIGMVEGDCVVDPVTEERDVDTSSPCHLDDPRLLIRADSREDPCRRYRPHQHLIVHGVDLSAGYHQPGIDADLAAHGRRNGAVIAGDDLDLDAEPVQP